MNTMDAISEIQELLNLEILMCKSYEDNFKKSKQRIEQLKQKKTQIIKQSSFEQRLKIKGINISEYTQVDVSKYFNEWWQTYLKIYNIIYTKDGLYYSINDDDEFINITIINSYDKNINDLIYIGLISIDHTTRKVYLYRDIDGNQIYFDKKVWHTVY